MSPPMMSMQPSGGIRSAVARTQRRCQKAWTQGARSRPGARSTYLHAAAPPRTAKMFAVTTEKAEPIDISVKCEPAIGEALRAQYASIGPGYHLNKRHWITITLNRDVPDERVRELVLDSYALVAPNAAATVTVPER